MRARYSGSAIPMRWRRFTRADPADRAAFDTHYQRVLSDPDNTNQAIEEDGLLAGMIASFTVEGDRELT